MKDERPRHGVGGVVLFYLSDLRLPKRAVVILIAFALALALLVWLRSSVFEIVFSYPECSVGADGPKVRCHE